MPEALSGPAKLGTIKRERHMVYAIKKSELRVFGHCSHGRSNEFGFQMF